MNLAKLLCVLSLLLLASCRSAGDSELQGTVLLWHSWEGEAAETLSSMTQRFEELYPDVNVISVYVEARDLKDQFDLAASLAFGADLLLTPSADIRSYVNNDLLSELPEDFDLTKLSDKALETTRVDDQQYGLPLSLNTAVLYYNPNALLLGAKEPNEAEMNIETDQITIVLPDISPEPSAEPEPEIEIASSLESLLEKASQGERVLIDTNFDQAVWGIRAFGDDIYNEQGELSLDEGFIAWLEWLQESQNSSAVFLNNNSDLLLELFSSGQASYYVGDSDLLLDLESSLGEDLVVMPLPSSGAFQAAGYLNSESLILNRMSSDKQQVLALELAQFLSNREQQRRLMRDLKRLPANTTVRIDERINPEVAIFKTQADAASVSPDSGVNSLITLRGNILYVQVLEGILSPEEALSSLQEQFGDQDIEKDEP